MSDETQKALTRALYKVLRPMVRLLMRHGVSYRSFADIARHVYVDVAEKNFALQGRKPSNARTAVLTGINRKDIAKLKGRPHPLSDAAAEAPAPAARIITGWINDARFRAADGEPLALSIDDSPEQAVSFAELTRRYSSDVPVRALLDELKRIGAVEVDDDQHVRLLVHGYVPQEDMSENIRIFGTAAADLLSTMDRNISGEAPGPFIQRTVAYDNIPVELLERIRRQSRVDGEALLFQVNEWLAKCDRDQRTDLIGSGRVRAGIGLYYFEHPVNEGERGSNDG